MLPCEIEPGVKEGFFTKTDVLTWIAAMQKVQEIKLYLKRFQQIVQIEPSENCIRISELFLSKTEKQIQALWGEFAVCESIVDQLIADADGQILEMLNIIKTFLNCYEDIIDCIRCKGNTEEVVQVIDALSAVMLLLQPLVSNMREH